MARIAKLRPGSVAHRCDQLSEGDQLSAVDGVTTAGLSHREVVELLTTAGATVDVTVDYEAPSLRELNHRK